MMIRRKLATGMGGLALLLGTLGGAFAVHAATPASPPAAAAQQPGNADPVDDLIDPSKVKITADQAKAAAVAQFPGATVKQVELQDENGTLVWGVELTDASGKAQDVKVDGNSGQIVADQGDAAGGPETPDAGETGD